MKRGIIFILLNGLICQFVFTQSNNVLVIVADDLGVDFLNRYNIGSDPAPTPTIDSLIDHGVMFTNAWTNPTCSPSRANILTGKYAFRTGIGEAIVNAQNVTLDTAEYTLAKAVKSQDVVTAMVGKWHLGHNSQAFNLNPNASGFNHYSGNIEGQLFLYDLWQKTVNGGIVNEFSYATTITVDDAIDWVDGQSKDWFLFLSFNAPHAPFHKPPNCLHSFDGLSSSLIDIALDPTPYFKAAIEAMDTELARFLDHLRSTGELAHTNVIFIGDNGSPPEVVESPFNPSKVKGTLYNGGVRIPMVVCGPAVVNPGRQAVALVNSTDLYHTVFELYNGDTDDLPSGAAPDSRSFLPLITNSSDSEDQRSWIYGDYFRTTPIFRDGKTITDGTYKLIEFDNGITEFYQISIDPLENSPLNINTLSMIAQDHYDFLCSELSELLDTNFCQVPTAIFEEEDDIIGIYPNPVNELLHIRLKGKEFNPGHKYTGSIYDTKGSLVQVINLSAENDPNIRVSDLAAGTYQLVISENGSPTVGATFIKAPASAVK